MPAALCRLCLCEGKLTSIFEVRDSVRLSTRVMLLAKVEIYPDDGLPSLICSKCIEILDTCLDFVHRCEKSDIKLRSCIQREAQEIQQVGLKKECDIIDNFNEHNYSDLTLNQVVLRENRINADIRSYLYDSCNEKSKVNSKKAQKQQCSTCGKVMSSRFRLQTHLRTHTGERPFQCPHCNKNFSLAQSLKVHLRIHTGEKPLSCNICGETFAHSAGLSVHRRKHTGQTPYKCMLCPRSFRTIGHLQYHIRRHTDEKNFECDTCGRAFITRSDLKQHLMSHTGDKPHICPVCGLRLTRASHLTRHMRNTHSDHKNEKHKNKTSCNKIK